MKFFSSPINDERFVGADAGEHGLRPEVVSAHYQTTGAIDRAADHLVAQLPGGRPMIERCVA